MCVDLSLRRCKQLPLPVRSQWWCDALSHLKGRSIPSNPSNTKEHPSVPHTSSWKLLGDKECVPMSLCPCSWRDGRLSSNLWSPCCVASPPKLGMLENLDPCVPHKDKMVFNTELGFKKRLNGQICFQVVSFILLHRHPRTSLVLSCILLLEHVLCWNPVCCSPRGWRAVMGKEKARAALQSRGP